MPVGRPKPRGAIVTLAPLLILAVALVLAASSAASQRAALGGLITNTGIGKLRLGMSRPAAEKLLKRVGRRQLKRRISVSPRLDYVEYEYRPPYVAYEVGYLVPRGKRGTVALIGTYVRGDRTRQGLHIGVTQRRLVTTYRGRARCGVWPDRPAGTSYCRIGGRRGVMVFLMKAGGAPPPGKSPPPLTVTSIVVKTPALKVSLVGDTHD